MSNRKWRIDAPPKDGREIEVMIQRVVRAFWSKETQSWVLSRELVIDELENVSRWRPR